MKRRQRLRARRADNAICAETRQRTMSILADRFGTFEVPPLRTFTPHPGAQAKAMEPEPPELIRDREMNASLNEALGTPEQSFDWAAMHKRMLELSRDALLGVTPHRDEVKPYVSNSGWDVS